MLELLIELLGLQGQESEELTRLLNIYISNAQQEFLLMTNLKEIPSQAGYIIIQMAAVQYNKRGSQGVASENNGGVSLVWEKNYPAHILKGIASYRKIQW